MRDPSVLSATFMASWSVRRATLSEAVCVGVCKHASMKHTTVTYSCGEPRWLQGDVVLGRGLPESTRWGSRGANWRCQPSRSAKPGVLLLLLLLLLSQARSEQLCCKKRSTPLSS
jgi:hypothetical protein